MHLRLKSGKKIETVQDWLETDDIMCKEIVDKKYLIDHTMDDGHVHKEDIISLLHRISLDNKDYLELIGNLNFMPGGRIIANVGLEKFGVRCTFSNCYVLEGPEDNIESIYEVAKKMARTFSYGGGVGIDISRLSPKNARVNNTAERSTGAVSFCETYSVVSNTIGMKARRGALMICINDTHPDMLDFITHKKDLNLTTGANMSVKMSEEFFKAYEKVKTMNENENKNIWKLYFKRPETGEVIEKHVNPDEVMNVIAQTAWDYAEPGILYWDRVNDYCLLGKDKTFKYEATNPCGELPLPNNGACLLGSMNLSSYFNDQTVNFDKEMGVGINEETLDKFEEDVHTAIRYLNEVLEINIPLHPLKEQQESVQRYRPIGLGIMGLADTFIQCGIEYGSKESIELSDYIGYIMAFNAIEESCNLAKEYGRFTGYSTKILESDFFIHNVIKNPFIDEERKNQLINHVEVFGLRNSQLLSIAPTGTISTILNISGGIEPVFSNHYQRTTKSISENGDKTYDVYPKVVYDYVYKQKHPEIVSLSANVDEKNRMYNEIKINVDKLPKYFVTAKDVYYKDKIDVQAIWQTHIDNSISSTVNLPEDITVEEVKDLYLYAYKKGLKGITVCRENCKRTLILKDTSKEKENEKEESKERPVNKLITRKELGKRLNASVHYVRIACGHIYIVVSRDENDNLVEVFMQSSKSGGCSANAECLGRYASACLRHGMDIKDVIDITKGVKCTACTNLKGKGEELDGLSCGDAMARVIEEEASYYKNNNNSKKQVEDKITVDKKRVSYKIGSKKVDIDSSKLTTRECIDLQICPECGAPLYNTEGCLKCMNCSFSKC